jgi:hypothetical protein
MSHEALELFQKLFSWGGGRHTLFCLYDGGVCTIYVLVWRGCPGWGWLHFWSVLGVGVLRFSIYWGSGGGPLHMLICGKVLAYSYITLMIISCSTLHYRSIFHVKNYPIILCYFNICICFICNMIDTLIPSLSFHRLPRWPCGLAL